MGKNSGVSWTDHSWSCWIGCHKTDSPGCDNCYGERDMLRYGREPHVVARTSKATFYAPLEWKEPAFVFVNPWSDFFHRDADEWRGDAWDVIRSTPHLTYLVLTKRPENIYTRLPEDWIEGWPNVWLGVTAETQRYADERIPILLQSPAAKRFVSCEPLLGSITLFGAIPLLPIENPIPDWLIAGCESGPGRRKSEDDWFRRLRDDCLAWGIPFFLKQMDVGGRLVKMPELDGVTWSERPGLYAGWGIQLSAEGGKHA